MKGTVKRLDGSGHTTVEYDTDTGVVEEAEKILAQALLNRSALFDGTTREQIMLAPESGPGTILHEHDEVLIIPPMAGGSA